jgi:outer membrane receptor protein involved in Fe transport
VNFGNPALRPEEAISYEVGCDLLAGRRASASLTVYDRKQTDWIDWVGDTPTGPWRAENIGESRVFGADVQAQANWRAAVARIRYSWIGSLGDSSYISKYALNYPVHRAGLEIRPPAWRGVIGSVQLSYTQRLNQAGYFLLGGKVRRSFGNFRLFLEGTNLLGAAYEEIPGAPQPGRWVGLGADWDLAQRPYATPTRSLP